MICEVLIENQTFKMLDGIFYDHKTSDDIIYALDRAERFQYRIRIFYGKNGHAKPILTDVVGTITLTKDENPKPVLHAKHSDYPIRTQNIVAIKDSHGYLYQHQNFQTGNLRIAQTAHDRKEHRDMPYCILHNNTFVVAGKKIENLKRKIAFLKGGRMNT